MARFPLPLLLLALTAPLAAQQTIHLRSGNGIPGGPDNAITFLAGPSNAGFGVPFTAQDFVTASSGPQAEILTNLAGGWPWPMPSDPNAEWISTTQGSESALFAIDFQVTQPFRTARLRLDFAADDSLGEPGIAGAYLNGQAVTDTENKGGWWYVASLDRIDIASLLQQGTNTLYLYQRNTGGRGGFCFSAWVELDAALITPYGDGCGGGAGTPIYRSTGGLPQLGGSLQFDLRNLDVNVVAVQVVWGASDQTWMGYALPLDLGMFGASGCSLHTDVRSVFPAIALNGFARYGMTLPTQSTLIGQRLFTQVLVPDPFAPNTLGIAASNALEVRVGY